MSAIEQSFNFEGWAVRTVTIDGEPWFVARDVAQVLGYADPVNAIKAHCKGVANHHPLQTAGGTQKARVINEADVLRMIVSSRLPAAEQFERWVFETVLPEIRRTGSYSAPKSLEERTLELVGELHAKVQEQAQEIETLTPLAAQARTHNLGKGNVSRQAFAREIIKWALAEGFAVKQPQVMEFLGRKLDMFVVGHRADQGEATLSGERRGLSTTVKGTAENGHAYATGKLTPKGVEYAWTRIENYVREHGHLELPKKGIAA